MKKKQYHVEVYLDNEWREVYNTTKNKLVTRKTKKSIEYFRARLEFSNPGLEFRVVETFIEEE